MLQVLTNLVDGIPTTIGLTLGSLLIGALLAVPLMLARLSSSHLLRILAICLITGVRSIPPIVWLFIIFFGVGTDYIRMTPFSAALVGLGLISAAYLAEIYRGAFLSIHKGQLEAAAALNLGGFRTWIDVIGPQLFRVAIPAIATYAIGLLKDTAIASTIGVTELAFRGNQLSMATYRGFEVFSVVALLYIAISLPVAWFSRALDTRLRAKVSH